MTKFPGCLFLYFLSVEYNLRQTSFYIMNTLVIVDALCFQIEIIHEPETEYEWNGALSCLLAWQRILPLIITLESFSSPYPPQFANSSRPENSRIPVCHLAAAEAPRQKKPRSAINIIFTMMARPWKWLIILVFVQKLCRQWEQTKATAF